MADFDFSSMFNGALDWAKKNPGAVGAGIGALGTLFDPAQDTTKTTNQTVQLPDYAAPYVGSMLNTAQGLVKNDYQPYSGPRIADFNEDQMRAFENVRNMQAMNPQQQQGAGIVGQAADQLLQKGNATWDQAAADRYMNPYQQNVIDIQKNEAMRDYQKQLPAMAASAVKAGAFGGDRQAILQAEAQRNLNQNLQNIQATGTQQAYNNAQNVFNTDMSRQGNMLSSAGTAGNTLAGIGQQGFQNQLAVNQGIMGIGNQQQGLQQKSLDTGYSDFQQQKQYPYEQLKFMQSMLGGLPMTQTQTANTTPAPTLAQQLISAGIGGYTIGSGIKP